MRTTAFHTVPSSFANFVVCFSQTNLSQLLDLFSIIDKIIMCNSDLYMYTGNVHVVKNNSY